MSYQDEFQRRYGALFQNESWWEMVQALYEGPGHDWEGADAALDQLLYDLAKAKGLDTTQTCPTCRKTVDEPRSLEQREPYANPDAALWHGCRECRERQVQLDDERQRQQAEAKAKHEAWYASLTPEQQKTYDEEQRKQTMFLTQGLFRRDVQ